MDNYNLTLRQRKILHYLQQQKSYITGEDLAEHLHVSARTIRNDVTEINQLIKTSVYILPLSVAGDIFWNMIPR